LNLDTSTMVKMDNNISSYYNYFNTLANIKDAS